MPFGDLPFNPLRQNQVDAFETFLPQQFIAESYADVLIPSQNVQPMIMQAMYATPYHGPMRGNAIPIMYTRIRSDAVPRGPIGMATPSISPSAQITAQGETMRKAL